MFGQQTNSTPEKSEMPQGRSMAKVRRVMERSVQAVAAVWFHLSNSQHLVWLWMWSNRQFSGTRRASLWNGPSGKTKSVVSLVEPRDTNMFSMRPQWRVLSKM